MKWTRLIYGALLCFVLCSFSCGYSNGFKIERIKLELQKYDKEKERERRSVGVVAVRDDLKFKGKGKQVINLRGVNLGELIELTFGKVLEVPYVFDASLRSVTDSLDIEIRNVLTKRQFFNVMDEALDKVGVEVTEKDGVYFVFRKKVSQSQSYSVAQSAGGVSIAGQSSLVSSQSGQVRESRKSCIVVGVRYVKASEIASTMKAVVKELYSGVSVVDDDARKVIVLTGEDDKIRRMKKMVEALDIAQSQVMLEAQIIEVTLTDALQYGVEWFLSGEFQGITPSVKGTFNQSIDNSSIYSIVGDTGRLKLLVQAMKKEGLVRVISAPFMLVRDGKEASITVGTDVPILNSEQTTATSGTILQTVAYKKTGILLKITPVLISDGVVLSVYQESSQASSNTYSSINSPVVSTRIVSTDIISKDGQSVVIGGLIQDNSENTRLGIPGLDKMPVLSDITSFKSLSSVKTELLMILTPKIVENQDHWNKVIDNLSKKFSSLSMR